MKWQPAQGALRRPHTVNAFRLVSPSVKITRDLMSTNRRNHY